MNYLYELFLSSSSLNYSDVDSLNFKIAQHLGVFTKYKIYIIFSDAVIRFFIESPKDIAHLSEGMSLGVLKSVQSLPIKQQLSADIPKKRFLNLQVQASTNIYEFKEKAQTKKGLNIEIACFEISILPLNFLLTRSEFYYNSGGTGGLIARSSSIVNGFPSKFIEINFQENKRYFKKSFPKYLDIEKALHALSQDVTSSIFSIDGFPYFSDQRYLNLNGYQFDKHSFIIGSSGSGKSKFIQLLIAKISSLPTKNNYKILVIDPHASLQEDLKGIAGTKIIDFKSNSADLFPDANTDVSAATELTATLFKSLMADNFNSKLETVLKFSLLVLLTAQAMSLINLKNFITDIDFRNKILEHTQAYIPTNVKKFFGADFNELRTKFYNESIAPITALVDEMQTQPAINNDDPYSLTKHIQENFLTVFSLNKVSMGEKVVKTVAGLLIQQIFLIAQSRVINEKILLFIDEVSVVQNPALAAILSEARKFNLFVILTQQYFGQIEKDLQDSILTNVSNYYVFRISEEDARKLEGNLKIAIPSTVLESAKLKGLKEVDLKVKMLTELNPRECIFRVESGGQYLPCVKGRTLDVIHVEAPRKIDLEYTPTTDKLPNKFIYNESTDSKSEQLVDVGSGNTKHVEDRVLDSDRVLTDSIKTEPVAVSDALDKNQQDSSEFELNQKLTNHLADPNQLDGLIEDATKNSANHNHLNSDSVISKINQPNQISPHHSLMLNSSLGRAIIDSYNGSGVQPTSSSSNAMPNKPITLQDVLANQSKKVKK